MAKHDSKGIEITKPVRFLFNTLKHRESRIGIKRALEKGLIRIKGDRYIVTVKGNRVKDSRSKVSRW